MGKRSSYKRRARDYYRTPAAALLPLLPHLKPACRFWEPCAGDGALITLLQSGGHSCAGSWDVKPKRKDIDCGDAREDEIQVNVDYFITNPPWSRDVLHAIIDNLVVQAPTWLLIDADWAFTKQAIPFMGWCSKIVAVGRVKWIPGSADHGKDNCAWYLFEDDAQPPVQFYGRHRHQEKPPEVGRSGG